MWMVGFILMVVGGLVAVMRNEMEDKGSKLPPCYTCGHRPVQAFVPIPDSQTSPTYVCGCGHRARAEEGKTAEQVWEQYYSRRK